MENHYKIIKQEHIWTSEQKLKFCGYGEWVEEVDLLEFEYLGYQGCVSRVFVREPLAKEETYFGGHLCGYVKIPDTHAYFKKEDIDIDCHGGITFNQSNEEHWIGFDCAHSGDYVPAMEHMENILPELIEIRKKFAIPEGFKNFHLFNPVYRNMEYCIQQLLKMVDQLIDVAFTTSIKEGSESLKELDEQ